MDGNDSFTKLLLHCDGADAGTTFINGAAGGSSTVTANGSAQIDNAQSVFGGTSALLGAAGNFLSCTASADWNFGAGNFVVDLRQRPDATIAGAPNGTIDVIFVWGDDGTANNLLYCYLDGTAIYFTARSGGVTVAEYHATHGMVLNVWYHLAWVRSGTSFFIFKDGVALSLTTVTAIGSNSMPDLSARTMQVGGGSVAGPTWADEVRISKGTDRGWTTNFTVPPAAYGHEIAGAAGSYALTGPSSILTPKMAEGAGAFSLSGVAAGSLDTLAGGAGAYALSGISAPLNHAVGFGTGAPGAYLLSGQNVILHPALTLTTTDRLQLPVDYALAGARDQRYPVRRGRLR